MSSIAEWKIEHVTSGSDPHRFLITTEDGSSTIVDGRMFESTARQITALPFFLDACKKLAAWDAGVSPENAARLLSEACSFARAGIVKAEGLKVLDAIKCGEIKL